MLDNVAGLGPLPAFLDDPETEEIWINDPAQVLSNSASVRRPM